MGQFKKQQSDHRQEQQVELQRPQGRGRHRRPHAKNERKGAKGKSVELHLRQEPKLLVISVEAASIGGLFHFSALPTQFGQYPLVRACLTLSGLF
jgi:hypothetical protein